MTKREAILGTLFVLAMFIGGLVAGYAHGEWPHDCVCSINGPKYGGSGTLLAVGKNGHGLVISAAHVFEDGNNKGLTCEFPAIKKKFPAKFLAWDTKNDIAAIDIADAPDIQLPAGKKKKKKSDGPFSCVGYPSYSRHEVRWTVGDYLGYEKWEPGKTTFLTKQEVASGYSGGARFNRFGEYCGPISGKTGPDTNHMDKTWGVSGDAMLLFVGKFVEVSK